MGQVDSVHPRKRLHALICNAGAAQVDGAHTRKSLHPHQ